jgi:hypothetical protein
MKDIKEHDARGEYFIQNDGLPEENARLFKEKI